jgi:DNA invertase Pin-like site-specific DNA recombinase
MVENSKGFDYDRLVDENREVIGYVRVSTDLQDIGKQKDTIRAWARRERVKITRFEGVEMSTMKSLDKRKLGFLAGLKSGDILVSTETSRLSRTVVELLTLVEDLLKRGIRVVFVLQGLDLRDLSNPTTKLTLQMVSVMAEHERGVISQRTKEALRVLKERGIKLGKPKVSHFCGPSG